MTSHPARPVHPKLVEICHEAILQREARMTPEQREVWNEVYRRVGRDDPFLLLTCIKRIRRGASLKSMERYIPEVSYVVSINRERKDV